MQDKYNDNLLECSLGVLDTANETYTNNRYHFHSFNY
jgi:hypothetical protein